MLAHYFPLCWSCLFPSCALSISILYSFFPFAPRSKGFLPKYCLEYGVYHGYLIVPQPCSLFFFLFLSQVTHFLAPAPLLRQLYSALAMSSFLTRAAEICTILASTASLIGQAINVWNWYRRWRRRRNPNVPVANELQEHPRQLDVPIEPGRMSYDFVEQIGR